MKNLDFLKQVLMSDAEYWLVAEEVTVNSSGRTERRKDNIMFIAIPSDIKRGLKYEEITLAELEKLRESYCEQNIYLNTDYPPFQRGISFYHIYKGYPITTDVRKFMLDALALNSDDIWEYKKLIQVEKTDIVEV